MKFGAPVLTTVTPLGKGMTTPSTEGFSST